jgi:WASH complex subunit 7
LNKSILKLGHAAAGGSYLDQFRLLITSMGNVVAFVRMMRTADLFDAAQSMRYFPGKDEFQQVAAFGDEQPWSASSK